MDKPVVKKGEVCLGPDGMGYRITRDRYQGDIMSYEDFEPVSKHTPRPLYGHEMPDWLDEWAKEKILKHLSSEPMGKRKDHRKVIRRAVALSLLFLVLAFSWLVGSFLPLGYGVMVAMAVGFGGGALFLYLWE